MKTGQIISAAVFGGILVFGLGYCVGGLGGSASVADGEAAAHDHGATAQESLWTCPMHPQIRASEPGSCPICGMSLVPTQVEEDAGPRRLRISASDALLLDIETAAVERRYVSRRVRLVGEVDFDETRVRTVAARVPGRLDRLFVDYTGVQVQRGDHLVELYSPALYTAQQELIEARHRIDDARSERSQFLIDSDRDAFRLGREKLLEWGLSEAQVDEVLVRGTAEDRMTIVSPIRGVVIHKNVDEGDYVGTGTRLYRIAELDRLWVQVAGYEKDLPWIRYGQAVSLTADALPGEVFDGLVSFIDPVLDVATRTVRIRVKVDNLSGRLKPGMFVRAVVDSRLASDGRVLEPRLAGKWISPMHPEVIKDGPGVCDVCGMPLVPAEELGYVTTSELAPKPLVIPYSAVLPTGRRAVVYVKVPAQDKPTFEGREVVLGPRADADQIVLAGLAEYELVVTNGSFKLDSALQIRAKTSMLSIGPGGEVISAPRHEVFRTSVEPLWAAYFELERALTRDDADTAGAALAAVRAAVAAVRTVEFGHRDIAMWRDSRAAIERAADDADGAGLPRLREAFRDLSRELIDLDVRYGHAGDRVQRETFCPMAFDGEGATWLQLGDTVRNPYFGSAMLSCGEFRRLLPGYGGTPDAGIVAAGAGGDGTQEGLDGRPATPGDRAVDVALPDPVLRGVTALFVAGIDAQRALAADDLAAAHVPLGEAGAAATDLLGRLDQVPEPERAFLEERLRAVGAAVRAAHASHDLTGMRVAFGRLSAVVVELLDRYGHVADEPIAVAHCPMAFDGQGADWLQFGADIRNPYYGSEMLDCGSVERDIPPATGHAVVAPDDVSARVGPVYDAYFEVHEALAVDDPDGRAAGAAARVAEAARSVSLDGIGAALAEQLPGLLGGVAAAAIDVANAADLVTRRAAFEPLAAAITGLHDALGHRGAEVWAEAHCPMAFGGKGADWIQRGIGIHNPYYGSEMLDCGSVTRRLPGDKD